MKFLIMIEDVCVDIVECSSEVSVQYARDRLLVSLGRVWSEAVKRGVPKSSVRVICELPSLLR